MDAHHRQGPCPASGGGTTNFLQADGDRPAASRRQRNPAIIRRGASHNNLPGPSLAADVEIEGGQLGLCLRFNASGSRGGWGEASGLGFGYGQDRLGFLGPDGKSRLFQTTSASSASEVPACGGPELAGRREQP